MTDKEWTAVFVLTDQYAAEYGIEQVRISVATNDVDGYVKARSIFDSFMEPWFSDEMIYDFHFEKRGLTND